MRNLFKIAGLLALTGFISSCNDKETTANYQVIPLPQEITTAQSQSICFADNRTTYNFQVERILAHHFPDNISSPNTKNLRSLQSGDALTELLETLKNRQLELAEENQHYVPLVLKVAPDLEAEDIQFIAKQLLQFKIDGLIVTNTTLSREGVENLPFGDEAGGLSGAPVFEKSTACLKAFAEVVKGQIPLIGVGGILSMIWQEEIPVERDRTRNMWHFWLVLQCCTCSRATGIPRSSLCFWTRHFPRWIRSEVPSA
jgi:dihydroorotate dehydrogenase